MNTSEIEMEENIYEMVGDFGVYETVQDLQPNQVNLNVFIKNDFVFYKKICQKLKCYPIVEFFCSFHKGLKKQKCQNRKKGHQK